MQIPYGCLIILSILTCVFLNNRFENRRCVFILLFLCPNIAGAFGLCFVDESHHAGRYICYLLTGPYNAAFVLILSLQIANTAGHTKKVVTNAVLFLGYCTGNIAGPFFYKTDQAPGYKLGIWSMIVRYVIQLINRKIKDARCKKSNLKISCFSNADTAQQPPPRSLRRPHLLVPHEEGESPPRQAPGPGRRRARGP